MNAVEVRNLGKNYPLEPSQGARLRHLLFPGNARFRHGLWALRNVSFSVAPGEAFGIIGANGSGKSTLLRLIAGVLRPTEGSVELNGRLSALLELGSGFSPEFTGRENVYLNASILGMSREETERRFGEIESFAEIGDFIDQPIRTYSSGMVLRLAFAVAAHADPEILIVDEALAVGDIAFRQRCLRRIHDLRASGATILFVSHDAGDVKALCERCLWLDKGEQRRLGETDDVVAQYLSATNQREKACVPVAPPHHQPVGPGLSQALPRIDSAVDDFSGHHRYGDGRATITGSELTNGAGEPIRRLEPKAHAVVRLSFRLTAPVASPIAGFLIRNGKGENIFGTNTARENYPASALYGEGVNTVDFHWSAPELHPGRYYISIAISDGNAEEFTVCDYVEDAIAVDFTADQWTGPGYMKIPCAAVSIYRG